MDATSNIVVNNITQKIANIRNNFISENVREKDIERQIQLYLEGDRKPTIPEKVDQDRLNKYLNDPDFIYKQLLVKMPHEFKNLSDEFKNDKKYVLRAVENNNSVLQDVNPVFRNDKEVITRAITGSEFLYERGYKPHKGGHALQYASEELKNDKDLVLLAVKETGTAIQYASESLRNDKEVIKQALYNTKEAFQYLSESLKDDKKFVLESMDQFISYWLGNKKESMGIFNSLPEDGSILSHVSERLKDDKKVVLASLEFEAKFSLKDVSERLQDDKEIVLKAVKKTSSDLKYASEDLRNDREVVYAAIKRRDQNFDSELLKYASEDLQKIVQEKGLAGLQEKPVSKLTSIINTLRDLTMNNGSGNTNKYR